MRYSEHDEIPEQHRHKPCKGVGCTKCHWLGIEPREARRLAEEERQKDEYLSEKAWGV